MATSGRHARPTALNNMNDGDILRHLVQKHGLPQLIALLQSNAMIQYLINKHGLPQLIAILQSTANSPSYNNNTYSGSSSSGSHVSGVNPRFGALSRTSVISDSSSATGSVFSDISSSTNGDRSDVPPLPPHPVWANSGAANRPYNSSNRQPGAGRSPSTPAASKDAPFQCPFCAEHNIAVTIARKSDLKRHFHNFHHTNSQWTCSLRGCQMVFPWKSAYETHLKESHRGVHPDEVVAETCPQVVFACGFVKCKQVYEATDDSDAEAKATDYFAHVANHFNAGDTHVDWSYSVRFRNLMRQQRIDDAWKGRARARGSPCWQPQTTSVLRAMLETRHVSDESLFAKWAATLGQSPYSDLQSGQPKLPQLFIVPIRKSCPRFSSGHGCMAEVKTEEGVEGRGQGQQHQQQQQSGQGGGTPGSMHDRGGYSTPTQQTHNHGHHGVGSAGLQSPPGSSHGSSHGHISQHLPNLNSPIPSHTSHPTQPIPSDTVPQLPPQQPSIPLSFENHPMVDAAANPTLPSAEDGLMFYHGFTFPMATSTLSAHHAPLLGDVGKLEPDAGAVFPDHLTQAPEYREPAIVGEDGVSGDVEMNDYHQNNYFGI